MKPDNENGRTLKLLKSAVFLVMVVTGAVVWLSYTYWELKALQVGALQ